MTPSNNLNGAPAGMAALSSEELALEPAWADFAYRLRTGSRIRRHPFVGFRTVTEVVGSVDTLPELAQRFEVHRSLATSGKPQHLFFALQLACAEGVPLPYWVAVAIERITETLNDPSRWKGAPPDLHTLFGLDEVYPRSDTRAYNARKRWQRAVALWHEVERIQETEGLLRTAALLKACKALGIGKRTADDMLDEVRTVLNRHPRIDKKVHRIRR